MKLRNCAWLATALASSVMAAPPSERSGQEIVERYCAKCHASATSGAPRIGDRKAWEPRASRGLSSLTASAIGGVRKMPPHGGAPEVNDLELARAITYMVNQSGGHWVEPTDRTARPAERGGRQIVQSQCIKCHGEGLGGAPRLDDKRAWIDRAKLGMDGLVRSAIHGHGGMPARGGLADLTDAEMRAAVSYMVQTGLGSTK